MDVATRAGVGQTTIHDFETAKRGGWRRDTDRIVAAYAQETGMDQRTLWRRAIDLDE